METNFQQTQEIPQAQGTSVKKPSKGPVAIIVLLTLIFVVLGAILAYQVIKTKVNTDQTDQRTTQETGLKDSVKVEEEKQDTTTENEAEVSDKTGQTNAPDIDKDLESLDELDLSGIENDYAEDQLGDF